MTPAQWWLVAELAASAWMMAIIWMVQLPTAPAAPEMKTTSPEDI